LYTILSRNSPAKAGDTKTEEATLSLASMARPRSSKKQSGSRPQTGSPNFSRPPSQGIRIIQKASESGEFPILQLSFNQHDKVGTPIASPQVKPLASPGKLTFKFPSINEENNQTKNPKKANNHSSGAKKLDLSSKEFQSPPLNTKTKSPQEQTLELMFSPTFIPSPKSLLNKAKLSYKDVAG
jgi:hypothetical protein